MAVSSTSAPEQHHPPAAIPGRQPLAQISRVLAFSSSRSASKASGTCRSSLMSSAPGKSEYLENKAAMVVSCGPGSPDVPGRRRPDHGRSRAEGGSVCCHSSCDFAGNNPASRFVLRSASCSSTDNTDHRCTKGHPKADGVLGVQAPSSDFRLEGR